jgi:hypothetical protein
MSAEGLCWGRWGALMTPFAGYLHVLDNACRGSFWRRWSAFMTPLLTAPKFSKCPQGGCPGGAGAL